MKASARAALVATVFASAAVSSSDAMTYELSAGADFEAECLALVGPGDTCYLGKGDYFHDGLTKTHGEADARITITGHSQACIRGSATQDRVLQIAHDYYTIENICFEGGHGDDPPATAIYVLGADKKSKKNGVTSSVTGLRLLNLEIKDFYEECIHFRYFVTHAEIAGCTIQYCGREDFEYGGSGKVGEGIYLGTALDQVGDGKAPEVKIRSGGADNVDADVCRDNWIHHNTFRTYGNECVDVKEGSTNIIIENNVCEQQKDSNSGGFGLRGSGNVVRFNEIENCSGAGVRVGGDKGYGESNHIYGNKIKSTGNGAFNVMTAGQGTVCENELSDISSVTEGAEKSDSAFDGYADGCSKYPGSIDGYDYFVSDFDTPSTGPVPTPAPVGSADAITLAETVEETDAGVNGLVSSEESGEIYEVSTNNNAGGTGLGGCSQVLEVSKVMVEHDKYVDSSTHVDSLFDDDETTYYSINRESTSIILELSEESQVNGVSIGFFMKLAAEKRIQTFDVAVRGVETDEDWVTVYSREESSGDMLDMQHFPFTKTLVNYVKFESHGNSFNNWTPLYEFEVCGPSAKSNALFNGVKAAVNGELLGEEEIKATTYTFCEDPQLLAPAKAKCTGTGNVLHLFDNSYTTRWATGLTTDTDDHNNGAITLQFPGDRKVWKVQIAFFDGHLASQFFAIYKQSAKARTWTHVGDFVALKTEALQTFLIEETGVAVLYIVGHGNSVGNLTKVSEVKVYGC